MVPVSSGGAFRRSRDALPAEGSPANLREGIRTADVLLRRSLRRCRRKTSEPGSTFGCPEATRRSIDSLPGDEERMAAERHTPLTEAGKGPGSPRGPLSSHGPGYSRTTNLEASSPPDDVDSLTK